MRLILTILLIGLFKADAQMVINASAPYRPMAVSGCGDTTRLLDSYTGAASAYSLRKLRANYTGSAIRVRRSSDNAEQNIGFDNCGNLDTTALINFVGLNDGFITTWYDQIGSRNATQSTASNQPIIRFSAGTISRLAGEPAIRFRANFGFNEFLSQSGADTIFKNRSNIYIFAFAKSDVTTIGTTWIYNNLTNVGNTRFGIAANLTANRFSTAARRLDNQASATIATFGTNHDAIEKLITGYANYGSGEIGIYSNGAGLVTNTLPSTGNTSNTNGNGGFIGSGNTTAQFFAGQISEIIIYISNQSSNRTGIESNINTYYGIY